MAPIKQLGALAVGLATGALGAKRSPLRRVAELDKANLRGFSFAQGNASSFDQFTSVSGRSLESGSPDHALRQARFAESAAYVELHNSKTDRLWTAALNEYSDWTLEELAALKGEFVPRSGRRTGGGSSSSFLEAQEEDDRTPLPETVDWLHLNTAKDVQSQGACGSCWAVATTTLLRFHNEIHRKDSTPFSTQQLVSCVPNPRHCGGNGGCQGATTELAMTYVMKHGLVHAKDFPYLAKGPDVAPCPQGMEAVEMMHALVETGDVDIGLENNGENAGGLSIGVKGWTLLPENEMKPLMRALYESGPAKVSIAVPEGFYSYSEGIMDGCPKDAVISHGAVLLGYGADAVRNSQYWTLQNSWGPNWGEDGHFRFLRRSAMYEESKGCGWDREPTKGNGCPDGPSKLRVCGMCGILSNAIVPNMEVTSKVPQTA